MVKLEKVNIISVGNFLQLKEALNHTNIIANWPIMTRTLHDINVTKSVLSVNILKLAQWQPCYFYFHNKYGNVTKYNISFCRYNNLLLV